MTVNMGVGPLYGLRFAYDPKGRRIQKVVTTNGTSFTTLNYLYDGWNPVAILNSPSSILTAFIWGSDLSGSQQGAGGVGGLLEVSYRGTATTNCFAAFDGNGNIVALINAANGMVTANYEYGPFGEVIRATGPMAKVNPIRFSTKYDDDESDLLYYGYRYFKPSTGAWLNRDPKQRKGEFNLYAFVANGPINQFDKLGLYTIFCDKCTNGNIRNVSVADWSLIPTINQGYPNVVSSAMSALDGSELVGWVSDIGGVAGGLTAAELAEKIAEVAKSVADAGVGHGISPDSGKIVNAINRIQKLYGQQQGYFIDVYVTWQKCEMTTSGGLPFTSHLDWVSHNNWYIDSDLGTSGPSGDGFAPDDTTGIANALGLGFVEALQNTSY